MSSSNADVPKMVRIYKNLFLFLVAITGLGIAIAYIHGPVWIAIAVALVIIVYKSKLVLDSFKHLLQGRHLLTIVFALTAIFVAGLLLLPVLNHEGFLLGTVDISKQLQMDEKPVEGHGAEGQHGN